jgi:hypothetical protein
MFWTSENQRKAIHRFRRTASDFPCKIPAHSVRRSAFPLIMALIVGVTLPSAAQSNELMDAFLAEGEASVGHAAYFVLSAAGTISEDAPVEEAITVLREQSWRIPDKPGGSAITLGEYSLLLMKALGIRGGIMYRIFPIPRYAAREMDYLEFITGSSHPGRKISGEEALRMLSRVLEWQEERS